MNKSVQRMLEQGRVASIVQAAEADFARRNLQESMRLAQYEGTSHSPQSQSNAGNVIGNAWRAVSVGYQNMVRDDKGPLVTLQERVNQFLADLNVNKAIPQATAVAVSQAVEPVKQAVADALKALTEKNDQASPPVPKSPTAPALPPTGADALFGKKSSATHAQVRTAAYARNLSQVLQDVEDLRGLAHQALDGKSNYATQYQTIMSAFDKAMGLLKSGSASASEDQIVEQNKAYFQQVFAWGQKNGFQAMLEQIGIAVQGGKLDPVVGQWATYLAQQRRGSFPA